MRNSNPSEETKVYDPTSCMGASMRDHARAIAEEEGEDLEEVRSCVRMGVLPDGRQVETWYDETSASPFSAWQGFVLGVGTLSGSSRDEVLAQFAGRG